MKTLICFTLLFYSISGWGVENPARWRRGSHFSGETCTSEVVKSDKQKAEVLLEKNFDSNTQLTFVEFLDYANPISIVSVPEGSIDENFFKVKIKARKMLNGNFTTCKRSLTRDPKSWDRGSHKSGEKCYSEYIQSDKNEAESIQEKKFDTCSKITFVEWTDYADPFSIVTVPNGNVGKNSIKVKIKARKYLDGKFTICTRFEILPSCIIEGTP